MWYCCRISSLSLSTTYDIMSLSTDCRVRISISDVRTIDDRDSLTESSWSAFYYIRLGRFSFSSSLTFVFFVLHNTYRCRWSVMCVHVFVTSLRIDALNDITSDRSTLSSARQQSWTTSSFSCCPCRSELLLFFSLDSTSSAFGIVTCQCRTDWLAARHANVRGDVSVFFIVAPITVRFEVVFFCSLCL